jgi:hypothetical protein
VATVLPRHADVLQPLDLPPLDGLLAANLLTPAVYLSVGSLVDRLITPLNAQPAWLLVAPLVGSGPGSAIGLLFVLGGGLVALLAGGLLAFARFRAQGTGSVQP